MCFIISLGFDSGKLFRGILKPSLFKHVLFLFFIGLCGFLCIWKDQKRVRSRVVALNSMYLDTFGLNLKDKIFPNIGFAQNSVK